MIAQRATAQMLVDAGEKLISPVKWTRQSYAQDGNEILSPQGLEITIYPTRRRAERLKSEGAMNHNIIILNITRTNAIPGAQRKDDIDGLYTCTVCTQSGCRSSSLMLFLIGGPPKSRHRLSLRSRLGGLPSRPVETRGPCAARSSSRMHLYGP